VNNSIRTALTGITGGCIVGFTIAKAIDIFNISSLLAWIIAGAAIGGFEATAWIILKHRAKTVGSQYDSAVKYQSMTSKANTTKALTTIAGTLFFAAVAAVHGVTATAASSMIFLSVLWLFTLPPLIFLGRMWRPWTNYRSLSNWYLAVSTVISVLVLAGVLAGYIPSAIYTHP
jgi:hypothetical protein